MIKEKISNIKKMESICFLAMFCSSLLLFGCSVNQSTDPLANMEIISVDTKETATEGEKAELEDTSYEVEDSENEDAEEIELPSFEVEPMEAVKYAATSLNVRSGPTTDFDIIGYFIVNEEVQVTGRTDTGWYQVDYLGEIAYASDVYLGDEKIEIPVEPVVVTTGTEMVDTGEAEVLAEIVESTAQVKNYVLNTSIDGAGIVFIGDSRTVAMYLATKDNNSLWVGAVGKGRDWFVNYGSVQADPYIVAGTKVVINLGVNDTGQVKKYITNMNEICQTWIDRGASIYYLSVNPLDYSKYVTNDNIVSFNATLSAGLNTSIKWIDSYSYLIENGYTTVDGLHFSKDTSLAIYNYCLSNL